MNRKTTLIAASLLAGAAATSACKGKTQDAETGDESAPPAVAEPAQPSAADQPAPPPATERFEISATQLGPLAADTEATAEGIARAFPAATVSARKQMAEGTEHEVFTVKLDGALALVVTPGAQGAIDRALISSNHFRTAAGLGIGSSFEEVQAAGQLDCIGGADDAGGTILCRPADIPTLAFVFASPEAGDYYAKPVPAEVQGQLLAGQRVVELLWQPGLGD